MKGAVVADQQSSMMTLASVRPPVADLADEVLDECGRDDVLRRILADTDGLPPRLAAVAPQHRSMAATAMRSGLVAAAVIAVVAVASVLVTERSGPASTPASGSSTAPALTLAAVREQTVAAVSAEHNQVLDLDIAITDRAGARAGSLRVRQQADGDQVRVDELDAAGNPLTSTLLTSTAAASTNLTVDHRTRTWTQTTTAQPEATTDGDPAVVYATPGSVPTVALAWVGSPHAIDALLSSGQAHLDTRAGQLIITAPLSALGSVSTAMATAAQLLPGATVELTIDPGSHLPIGMVVHDATGATSEAHITWTPAEPITLDIPDSYARR